MVDSRISRLQRKAARLNKLGIVSDDAMGRINDAMMSSIKPPTITIQIGAIRKHPENVIRTTRNSLQMSQRQFGAAIGRSESTVQRWETGRQKPKASSIQQIQKALITK